VIRGGAVAEITDAPVTADRVVDARGLVVAPGFIDLHCHTQSLPGDRMQAFDGVTTALELESGMLPVSGWYERQRASGRALNYGASASWTFARIPELSPSAGEPDGTITYFQAAFAHREWQSRIASAAQVERIVARIAEGLDQGGVGIGINNGYVPAAGTQELAAVTALAAQAGVPTFTHIANMSNIDPDSSFEAYLRVIALAAATGAHMHVCHLNSTSLRDARRCIAAIRGAQDRGLPITVEAYPYGAASTVIGAAFLADPRYPERTGAEWSDISVNATGERPATGERLHELQAQDPGAPIVWDFLKPDRLADDRALLDLSVLYPGGAIASDAMPWERPGHGLVEGDVWPLPEEAVAHPRSAGTFARFLSGYALRGGRIGLVEAIAKCTLIPARILEGSVPQMRTKGRIRIGSDADIVAFDPDRLRDAATFAHPARHSEGMVHVFVNGTHLIDGGVLDRDARPGLPIRRG